MSNFAFCFLILFSLVSCAGSSLIPPNAFENIPPHPRILLTPADLGRIKERAVSDTIISHLVEVAEKEAEKLLELPPVTYEKHGRRLLHVSREARRRIALLAFAYRMSSQQKFLDRAEAEMLKVSEFNDWNPSHFLDAAEMTTGMAIGLDWLHDQLSSRTKRIIRHAIIEKGLKPSLLPENNKWLTWSNNWNQVCNAGLALGALAVMDDEPRLGSEILSRSISSIRKGMQQYGTDGAYPEGYSYWDYGTTFNVLLISTLEKAFGGDFGISETEGFLKTPYYLMNIHGTSGLVHNYSDGKDVASVNPAMFWFASRLKNNALLYNEWKKIKSDNDLHRNRDLIPMIIWASSLDVERTNNTPSSRAWISRASRTPVALIRTSWSDPNAVFVGLKGGSPSVDHGHMDEGSFVVDALGERWALDPNTQDYGKLESARVDLWNKTQHSSRWNVLRNSNHFHNTLTVNDSLQRVDGYATVEILSRDSTSVSTDLSSLYSPMLRSAVRSIEVSKERVMVRDVLKNGIRPNNVTWRMATHANVTLTSSNTAELLLNGKRLFLKVHCPKKVELRSIAAMPRAEYDDPNPGVVIIEFQTSLEEDTAVDIEVELQPDYGSAQKN